MTVAIITGTSTGIGFETALQLARAGHDVYATMRSPERGQASLIAAARAEDLALTVLQLDVDDNRSVDRAIAEVLAKANQIDVLVNNAGIGDLCVLEQTTDEMAHTMFETNFFGALRMIRAVLPAMRERHSGTIVNVSSVAGRVASMGSALYAASKHALEAASESLALEMKPFGIRVAIIEPGFFNTPIIGKATSTIGFDETSPYLVTERRMHAIYSSATVNGGDPRVVAEAIEHAISTNEPKLRYLVGADAQVFADGREKVSDENWLEFGREMSEDEFWTEFATRFPMPSP